MLSTTNRIRLPEQWRSGGTRRWPTSLRQSQWILFDPLRTTKVIILVGGIKARKSWNLTKCCQRQTEFDSLNSDDPVAPDGDLLPYVKANESCSILRGQQKFYSLVGGILMLSTRSTEVLFLRGQILWSFLCCFSLCVSSCSFFTNKDETDTFRMYSTRTYVLSMYGMLLVEVYCKSWFSLISFNKFDVIKK